MARPVARRPGADAPALPEWIRPQLTELVDEAPERSDMLSASRDANFILRNFKTMYVNGKGAEFFGADQMKSALGSRKDFMALGIQMVDDPKLADWGLAPPLPRVLHQL